MSIEREDMGQTAKAEFQCFHCECGLLRVRVEIDAVGVRVSGRLLCELD